MKDLHIILILLVMCIPAFGQESELISPDEVVVSNYIQKDSVSDLLRAEQIVRMKAEMRDRENQQLRTEKKLKEAELEFRDMLIGAVSVSLLIAGILAWILFKQRKEILLANKNLQIKNEEISFQKNAIESQAEALLLLNEELQDLNKTLEGRINERTKQIFHQNKKLAEYTFMSAHKLRAPVASILGLINLFQQVDADEQKIILDYLKTCSEQLDATIRALSLNLEDGITETNVFAHTLKGVGRDSVKW